MEICYYMDDVLNTIHSMIKISNVIVDADGLKKADDKIQDYIRERINIADKKSDNILLLRQKDINIPRPVLVDIVLQYYAMANDNERLLGILKERDFNFVDGQKIKLYVLDKNFSSKFPFNKYIDMIVKEEIVFRRFYNLTYHLIDSEKEKYTEAFSEIICSKPHICNDNSKDGTFDAGFLTGLLSPRNIEFFGKDFLINSTLKQRRIIDSLGSHLKIDELNKVFDLLKKYPDFDCKIHLDSELLKVLSIDEIANMSTKDIFLYTKALSKDSYLVERIHNILQINPDFICSECFIRPEIFKTLSDEEIAGLTHSGVEAIEQIKIPLIKNVYVMPIRKVNRAVVKDNKLKKKLAKEEAKMHR